MTKHATCLNSSNMWRPEKQTFLFYVEADWRRFSLRQNGLYSMFINKLLKSLPLLCQSNNKIPLQFCYLETNNSLWSVFFPLLFSWMQIWLVTMAFFFLCHKIYIKACSLESFEQILTKSKLRMCDKMKASRTGGWVCGGVGGEGRGRDTGGGCWVAEL